MTSSPFKLPNAKYVGLKKIVFLSLSERSWLAAAP